MGFTDDRIFTGAKVSLMGMDISNNTSFGEIIGHYSYAASNVKFLQSINGGWHIPILYIAVTEKCSLRCAKCFALIPFYKTPHNVSLELTFEAVDRLLASGCHISTLCLSGGEPFINQEFIKKFLAKYKNEGQIGCFQMITNATVLIEEETAKSMEATGRMYVIFSNYGILSRKLSNSVEILQKHHIGAAVEQKDDVNMSRGTQWIDYGEVKNYHFPPKIAQKMFDTCVNATGCTTLLNGKLYICGRIAHGVNIGLIPDGKGLYFDLSNNVTGNLTLEEIRFSCQKLLNNPEYSPGCNYCNRLAYNLAERAKQLL